MTCHHQRCRYCSISDRYDLSGGSASEIFWNCRFTLATPGQTNAPHKTRLETTHLTGNNTKATAHAAIKSAIRRLIQPGLTSSHQNIAVNCDKEDAESNHELIKSPICRKHPARRSILKTPQAQGELVSGCTVLLLRVCGASVYPQVILPGVRTRRRLTAWTTC